MGCVLLLALPLCSGQPSVPRPSARALPCTALPAALQAGRDMIEFIACILLPVAVLMCGYAVSASAAARPRRMPRTAASPGARLERTVP